MGKQMAHELKRKFAVQVLILIMSHFSAVKDKYDEMLNLTLRG